MKHVVMTLILFSGLAITSTNAQSCNKVCPPGCCIVSCCTTANGTAAAVKGNGDVSLTTCSPEALSKICGDKKLSKKEMKACQAACEAAKSSATSDHLHVAPATGTLSCQPACKSSASGKESAKVALQQPSASAAKQTKG